MRRRVTATVFVCFALAGSYISLWAEEVMFDTKEDWSAWKAAKGTVEITEDGWVTPAFVRKDINASLNAREFGGGVKAGSAPDKAEETVDGDMTTWWSPRSEDPPEDWWIEVDLGRVITATRMVLKFAEQYSPFEQFEVYVSAGNEAFFAGSKLKDYRLVFRTTRPNDQDVIEYTFSLDATTIRAPDSPVIRYLYIRLTAPSDRPALAELEVYELGDNIALGTIDRQGSFETAGGGGGVGAAVADGVYTAYWASYPFLYDWTRQGWVFIDLGALYWVDTVRHIWFEAFEPAHVIGYKLFVSDGSVKGGGSGGGLGPMKDLVWDEVGSLDQNPPPDREQFVYIFQETLPIRPVRYLFFSHRMPGPGLSTGGGEVGISEFQVFGKGYVLGASLTSPIVDMGSAKNLTSLRWEAHTLPGTRIEVRTRTGESIDETTHYYGRNGKEIPKRKHDEEKQLFGASGPVVVEQVPDTTWSGWSEVYPGSGSQFLSPSPRRYLLVRIGFPSDDPSITPSLDKLTLVFANPVARTVTGEISPGLVQAAKPQDFSYFIFPTFDSGSAGFDQILIRTPSEPKWSGRDVEVGGQILKPALVLEGPDSLLVRLPSLVRSPSLVVVRFQCRVFLNGTPFEAFIGNSRQPEVWQRVDAGDATDRSRSDGIVVSVPVVDYLMSDVSVTPEVITPNGDSINDRSFIEFTVLNVDTPQRIEVTISSLGGRLVRKLPLGLRQSGRHRVEWDGTGQSGDAVTPGMYLFHITVDTDGGRASISGAITVIF